MIEADSKPRRRLTPLEKIVIAGIVVVGLLLAKDVFLESFFWRDDPRIRLRNACINYLGQIDGAKEQWALEHKKTPTDTPTWNDLIGTDKYIKVRPTCHANGTYTIGNMVTKPICSIPDHTLP